MSVAIPIIKHMSDISSIDDQALNTEPIPVGQPSGVDDDLDRDVTEILTSLCARLYGRRAAAGRAARAVAALQEAPG
jgi:predicted site-specific integrase-resolvase